MLLVGKADSSLKMTHIVKNLSKPGQVKLKVDRKLDLLVIARAIKNPDFDEIKLKAGGYTCKLTTTSSLCRFEAGSLQSNAVMDIFCK